VGKYYSEELQVFYTIGVKNRHLIFTHANPPTASLLSADGPDVFSFSGYEMKFIRNTTGEVIGFTFQSGKSVKNIFFEKMH
jgi:hypothetical protein